MGSLRLVAIALLLGEPGIRAVFQMYGVGRTPTGDQLRALDISISPTGEELPPGRGTAQGRRRRFFSARAASPATARRA